MPLKTLQNSVAFFFITSNGGIHLANLLDLPTNLPVPENDGKTDHLVGMKLADVELTSTQ